MHFDLTPHHNANRKLHTYIENRADGRFRRIGSSIPWALHRKVRSPAETLEA